MVDESVLVSVVTVVISVEDVRSVVDVSVVVSIDDIIVGVVSVVVVSTSVRFNLRK